MSSKLSERIPARAQGFTLVEVMIVAAMLGLLSVIAITNYLRARATAQRRACVSNLRALEGAKERWALENGKGETDTPIWTDLFGAKRGYLRSPPLCPARGTYSWNDVATLPTCSRGATLGHTL